MHPFFSTSMLDELDQRYSHHTHCIYYYKYYLKEVIFTHLCILSSPPPCSMSLTRGACRDLTDQHHPPTSPRVSSCRLRHHTSSHLSSHNLCCCRCALIYSRTIYVFPFVFLSPNHFLFFSFLFLLASQWAAAEYRS